MWIKVLSHYICVYSSSTSKHRLGFHLRNLEEIVNRTEPGQMAEVLCNLFGDVVAHFLGIRLWCAQAFGWKISLFTLAFRGSLGNVPRWRLRNTCQSAVDASGAGCSSALPDASSDHAHREQVDSLDSVPSPRKLAARRAGASGAPAVGWRAATRRSFHCAAYMKGQGTEPGLRRQELGTSRVGSHSGHRNSGRRSTVDFVALLLNLRFASSQSRHSNFIEHLCR